MGRKQCIAVIACLMVGIIGFAGVYATEKREQGERLAKMESQRMEREQQLEAASKEVPPKKVEPSRNETTEKNDNDIKVQETAAEVEPAPTPAPEPVAKAPTEPTFHFNEDSTCVWPHEGELILDYSMDGTVYDQTLEEYRYNPALIIAGNVNDEVMAVAKGKIIEVFQSEETGCTIRQDLGDGYIATYGQLKELNFDVGDIVESGQVLGYISEPTKYYTVEGSNVYFELQKDGKPVDPKPYLP